MENCIDGFVLKKARMSVNFTVLDVYRITEISPSTVTEIENGTRINPGIVIVKKLCDCYGIDIRTIFT